MSGPERLNLNAEFCSKRVWVLSVLADDEALDDPHKLPRGLAFHLSRCPACRATARRLRYVSTSLDDLSGVSVPNGLLEAAHEQARTALRNGGHPTGRVNISDEIDPPFARVEPRRRPWMVGVRYAAAAAVVLVVATFGVSTFRGRGERSRTQNRAVVDDAPRLRAAPSALPAAERLATGLTESAPPVPVSEEALPPSPADFVDGDDPFAGSSSGTASGAQLARRRPRPETPEPHGRRRVRRPGAPWCSAPGCVPTAVVLPGGARRMMKSASAPIDRRP